MSMMICEQCDNPIDTDFDLDGTWTAHGYICERCTEINRQDKLSPGVRMMKDFNAMLTGET